MYYSRKEEYTFRIPQEYTAFLDFRDELKASGIRFTTEGGSTQQVIIIFTNGVFENPGEVYSKR